MKRMDFSGRQVLMKAVAACAFAMSAHATDLAQAAERTAGNAEIVVVKNDKHEAFPESVKEPKDLLKSLEPSVYHVHRNYYSGDHEFQGPIVAAGLTGVCVRHPMTNASVVAKVMLPGGAPEIIHCPTSIVYAYPGERLTISFCRMANGRGGYYVTSTPTPCKDVWHKHASHIHKTFGGVCEESSAVQEGKQAAKDVWETGKGLAAEIDGLLGTSLQKAREATDLIPGKVRAEAASGRERMRYYLDSRPLDGF